MTVRSPRWRYARAGFVVTLAGFALAGLVGPTAASGAPAKVGYVRLAHLSPDTPDVDVYLDSVSSTMKEQVFKGVGYGVMSGYLKLPVGEYAVSMRLSGADPSTPPVLTTDVTVAAGHAYTVAGVGRHADLGLRVFNDDLSSPMNGKAKVRIIQASIKDPQLDVSTSDGETVAHDVPFATTTPYMLVSAGTLAIVVHPTDGGATVRLHVHLAPDNVYSLLVVDGKSGLAPDLKPDAAAGGPVPAGGVQTGLGGAAPRQVPVAAVSALALVGVVFGGLAVAARRRSSRQVVVRPVVGRMADRA